MRCRTLCLPCAGPEDEASSRSKKIGELLKKWKREERGVVQVVLLGTGESGKSTITKQMKIIHINGFNESERQEKVKHIRKNLRDAILTLCGAMSLLSLKLEDCTNEESIDYLLKHATVDDFTYPQVFYDHTQRLWEDAGIRECYRRSNEFQLIDCAKYFLDKITAVRAEDYLPSYQDILRCRVMTNTIQKIDFRVRDGKTEIPFSVYDVGGQQGERQKWIQVFDSATAILFLLDCSSFDLALRESPTKNRLLEAAEIFEQVWNHRWLRYVDVILFINKIDILEEKVRTGHRLDMLVDTLTPEDRYYELFQGFKSFNKPKDAERRELLEAFPFPEPPETPSTGSGRKISKSVSIRQDLDDEVVRTAVFIKRLFMQIMDTPRRDPYGRDWHSEHNCEYFYTCAIDTDNIRKVLNGCRNLIIKKHLNRYGIRL